MFKIRFRRMDGNPAGLSGRARSAPEWPQRPQETEHSQDSQDAVPARGQGHHDVDKGHEDQYAVQHIPGALEIGVFS